MRPRNFPARKLARQLRAQARDKHVEFDVFVAFDLIDAERNVRSKKLRKARVVKH
jgi:hypothetical protein